MSQFQVNKLMNVMLIGLFIFAICMCTNDGLIVQIQNEDIETPFIAEEEPVRIDYMYHALGDKPTRYLDETNYTDDYTYSLIRNYVISNTEEARLDLPIPLELSWETIEGECHVVIKDKDDANVFFDKVFDAGINCCKIFNLIPGKTYVYNVDESGTTKQIGLIESEETIRMIHAGEFGNIRDLGGWHTTEGGRLRYNRIIRGCEVDGLHNHVFPQLEDLGCLLGLGISAELDLRGNYAPSPLGDSVGYYPIRIGNYTTIKNAKQFAEVISIIIAELSCGGIVYIHCWGGSR